MSALMTVGPEDLVIGQVYRVEWDDCCAQGNFTARLTEKRYDRDEADFLDELIFDNGVTIGCHATSAVTFELVPEYIGPGQRVERGEQAGLVMLESPRCPGHGPGPGSPPRSRTPPRDPHLGHQHLLAAE